MSFANHIHFDLFRPYLRVNYASDGSEGKTRFRIELKRVPSGLRKFATSLVSECVACRRKMQPVRGRVSSSALYFAATCPLHVDISCSRSLAAREEYQTIREAVEAA